MMEKPEPRETFTNAPMLAAWKQDAALALQRCGHCGKAFFYPRSLCPHCHSPDLHWFRASGRGYIISFSRIHAGLGDGFQAEAPILLAEIALDDGPLMIARVVAPGGGAAEAIASGMAVCLVGPADAARFALPTFLPA